MRGSQYATSITNFRMRGWLQSSSDHPMHEDQEDAWSQNPKVHNTQQLLEEDDLVLRTLSLEHNLLEQGLLNAYATCVLVDGS